jgi:hypothetical protein
VKRERFVIDAHSAVRTTGLLKKPGRRSEVDAEGAAVSDGAEQCG